MFSGSGVNNLLDELAILKCTGQALLQQVVSLKTLIVDIGADNVVLNLYDRLIKRMDAALLVPLNLAGKQKLARQLPCKLVINRLGFGNDRMRVVIDGIITASATMIWVGGNYVRASEFF